MVEARGGDDSLIAMEGLSKVNSTEFVKTTALREITLKIGHREFACIMGPSGSGKSTFLSIAGLLENFSTGTYLLNGKPVKAMSDYERSLVRRNQIGFVFQGSNLIKDLTVLQNVEMPLRYLGTGKIERRRRAIQALEMVGLAGRTRHSPAQLSGGQQQRVAIARALVGEPSILFADEPTGNLDTEMANSVMELIAEVHVSGMTVVLVTHDPLIADQANRLIRLVDGRIVDDTSG